MDVFNEPTDWAWLAGLIDGEGSIQFKRSNKKLKGGEINSSYTAVVSIHMYSRESIARAAAIMDTSVRGYKNYDNTLWCTTSHGQKARRILEIILPWLTAKRQEALLLLEALACCPPQLGGRKHPLTSEDRAMRDGWYWTLRNAKKEVA